RAAVALHGSVLLLLTEDELRAATPSCHHRAHRGEVGRSALAGTPEPGQRARHSRAVPEAFKGVMDETTYDKSVQYTLASARLSQFQTTYDAAILLIVLFSGVLPRGFRAFTHWLGSSAWAMAAFLCVVGITLSLPSLPLHWYEQFRLEARFG